MFFDFSFYSFDEIENIIDESIKIDNAIAELCEYFGDIDDDIVDQFNGIDVNFIGSYKILVDMFTKIVLSVDDWLDKWTPEYFGFYNIN